MLVHFLINFPSHRFPGKHIMSLFITTLDLNDMKPSDMLKQTWCCTMLKIKTQNDCLSLRWLYVTVFTSCSLSFWVWGCFGSTSGFFCIFDGDFKPTGTFLCSTCWKRCWRERERDRVSLTFHKSNPCYSDLLSGRWKPLWVGGEWVGWVFHIV